MINNLTSLFAIHFFNDGFLASIALFLPFIARDLSLNLTQVGFLGSIFSLVGILLSLPVGHLTNKIGAMKILVWTSFFCALGFLLIGLSYTYVFLVLAFIIASIGFGSFHSPAFSEVAKNSPSKKKGKIMGDFTAIGEFGRICLSAVIPFLAVALGWRSTSIMYSFVAVMVFTIFFFHHHNSKKLNNQENTKVTDLSFLVIVRNPKLLMVLAVTFFDLLASSALFVFLPFLLIKKGIDPSILGAFTSAFFLGNLIGKMVLGRLTDLFTNTKVFIAAEILMAIFIVLLTRTNSVFGIIAFSIALGSLTMGTVPIRTTMLTDSHNHNDTLPKAFAVGSLVSSISSAMAPVILGSVADLFGVVNSFNVSAMFAVVAIIPAVVLLRQK